MTRHLLSLGLLIGVACASHPALVRSAEPIEDERAARAYEQRAEELERVLSAGAAPPDCKQVCALVGQICDLSDLICQISSRHPDDSELAGRCASGEQRCQRSRQRVPPGCSCPAR